MKTPVHGHTDLMVLDNKPFNNRQANSTVRSRRRNEHFAFLRRQSFVEISQARKRFRILFLLFPEAEHL